MTTEGIQLFKNSVESVIVAPYLLLLCPIDSTSWCKQYTQEGYNVLHIHYPFPAGSSTTLEHALSTAVDLIPLQTPSFGMIVFGLQDDDAPAIDAFGRIYTNLKVVVHYCPGSMTADFLTHSNSNSAPIIIFQLAMSQEELHASLLPLLDENEGPSASPRILIYAYPLVPATPPFPLLGRPSVENSPVTPDQHVQSATNISYTRTLTALRKQLGPHFDLEKVWSEHIKYEFEERDAIKTMKTMVDVPYVNHIPTMTGGVGREDLTRFYKYHFTADTVTPRDVEMIPVSRTVGSDRIVDEMIFKGTHTCEIDYLLPGVKPTGKPFEIALVGIIAFRGDKLFFEHIYWDQASLLVQIGLLDEKDLPVAGKAVADKVMDPFGKPSNIMLKRWKESEGLSID